jgi:hypothetical protein
MRIITFPVHAKVLGITPEQFRALMEGMTHRRRSTTLAELVNVAVFMASDRGGRDDRDGRPS